MEDPNELFVQVEFASSDEAKGARERLLGSWVLERVEVRACPTVAEEADTVDY